MGWLSDLLSSVGGGISDAAGSAGNFLGNLFGGGGGADIGAANPATFADTASAPVGMGAGDVAGSMIPGGETGMPETAIPVSPPNPMLESQKTPGNWWETTATNAMNQVQQNPWKAAGYGAMGAGMLGNAIMAGTQAPPGGGLPGRGMGSVRSQYQPNPLTNTSADPTLPQMGPYNSPLLRNQNGMNVRPGGING